MPLSPQRCRPTLTNADQTVTKVDKTDHRQPPLSTPPPFPRSMSDHPRTTLNKPEQIRTNPNTAERPDQIGTPPRSPPNTPKKTNPEHRRCRTQHPTAPLGRRSMR